MTELVKLHLKLGPPLPDPSEFNNHTSSMDGNTKAILSLRGYACAVSMLIPAYHFFLASNAANKVGIKDKKYQQAITIIFMKEAMFERLVIQLRRLYDGNRKSLSSGNIVKLLQQADVRAWLEDRSRSQMKWSSEEERGIFDANIKFVLMQCELQLKLQGELSVNDPMLATQAVLARRAANKRAAHMTLDDFGITNFDLHDLVFEACLIARAIQQCFGIDVCDTNYEEVDKGSYDASVDMFGLSHPLGLLLGDLDANLKMRRNRIA